MSNLINLISPQVQEQKTQRQIFLRDVIVGLSKTHKQISSKYFYDDHGSKLFNQITQHPDYYLSQCEIDILQENCEELSHLMTKTSFNLIELGPGEGIKSQLLLHTFLQNNLKFTYIPIDISSMYLTHLGNQLKQKMPQVICHSIHADYFQGLEWISQHSNHPNLVLFLGSSIGNYDLNTAQRFLQQLSEILRPQDYIIIGFDLRKDIKTLLRAYDDSDGITREFNLNLLTRVNRELGANFNLDKFYHHATYNVYTGAMESYLISTEPQKIRVEEQIFSLHAYEPILLEQSYKYLLAQIEDLAKGAGLGIIKNYTDTKEYFVDSLLQVC